MMLISFIVNRTAARNHMILTCHKSYMKLPIIIHLRKVSFT